MSHAPAADSRRSAIPLWPSRFTPGKTAARPAFCERIALGKFSLWGALGPREHRERRRRRHSCAIGGRFPPRFFAPCYCRRAGLCSAGIDYWCPLPAASEYPARAKSRTARQSQDRIGKAGRGPSGRGLRQHGIRGSISIPWRKRERSADRVRPASCRALGTRGPFDQPKASRRSRQEAEKGPLAPHAKQTAGRQYRDVLRVPFPEDLKRFSDGILPRSLPTGACPLGSNEELLHRSGVYASGRVNRALPRASMGASSRACDGSSWFPIG
jgi:hypothetical protein